MERRFLNPYRHWLSGLAFEIFSFASFLAALFVMALLIEWVR